MCEATDVSGGTDYFHQDHDIFRVILDELSSQSHKYDVRNFLRRKKICKNNSEIPFSVQDYSSQVLKIKYTRICV